ncbi:glutathione S-transferase 1-like [Diaphorina citri]|uniref:Glutathione S-transferase 1-like n=1 Tax=Diaphorina citri TaxID=121845 RepID=A0A3Q0J4W1_DIACI|nr:glutathione S-transferase 1-like [Diaphorina citri]
MALTLYYVHGSPPVRATQLCIRALGLEVNYEFVNLFQKENLQPAFLEKNPMHSVPVLDDNGFILWDSHAINEYLVSTPIMTSMVGPILYFKNDSPPVRSVKLCLLSLDLTVQLKQVTFAPGETLDTAFLKFRILFAKKKDIPEENIRRTRDVYSLVEKFLEKWTYIACDHITIADFSIVTTLTTLEVFVPEISNYPKVAAYIERCRANMKDYQEANQESLDIFKAAFQARMNRSSL